MDPFYRETFMPVIFSKWSREALKKSFEDFIRTKDDPFLPSSSFFFFFITLLVSNYSKDQWKVHSLFYYKKILLFFNLILHNLFLNILYNDICVLFQSVVRFILFDISVFLLSLFFFRNKLVSFRIRNENFRFIAIYRQFRKKV